MEMNMKKMIFALSFAALAFAGLAGGMATDNTNTQVAGNTSYEYPADEIDGTEGRYQSAEVKFEYPADEIDGENSQYQTAEVKFEYPVDELDGDEQLHLSARS
jgi:hypothetical protein